MVSSSIWHNMDGSPIIVTENVVEYRKAIAEYVKQDDVVLEVGCAEGLTTALIAQTAKQAFGIDKSESQTAKAVSRHQHILNLTFRQIDGWDMTAVRQLSAEHGVTNFDVIFIDVSGSRKVGDVESLLGKYEHVFNPRVFVVKAYQLKRLITRCKLFTLPQAVAAASGSAPSPVELQCEEDCKSVPTAEQASSCLPAAADATDRTALETTVAAAAADVDGSGCPQLAVGNTS